MWTRYRHSGGERQEHVCDRDQDEQQGGVRKAMEQIANRGYAEMYAADKRNVYVIGMCFEKKRRVMKEYKVVRVK